MKMSNQLSRQCESFFLDVVGLVTFGFIVVFVSPTVDMIQQVEAGHSAPSVSLQSPLSLTGDSANIINKLSPFHDLQPDAFLDPVSIAAEVLTRRRHWSSQ